MKFLKSIPQNDNRKLRYCGAASKDFTATAKLILMDFSTVGGGGEGRGICALISLCYIGHFGFMHSFTLLHFKRYVVKINIADCLAVFY